MSMAEMQACVARLYVDRTARRLFALEPDSVLGQYQLSPDEAQALRDLDQPALERFARSLKRKRRRRFVAAYPLLFGLGSPAVDRYYDRYYHLYPARPGGAYVAELLEFGRFVEECLAADDDAPPFASDLAQYERLRFAARQAASSQSGRVGEWGNGGVGAAGPVPPLSHSPTPPFPHSLILPDDRPRLADGVVLGTFRTGILAIVEALEAGLPPPPTGEGPYTFVFRPAPGAAEPEAFYVTTATCELLDLCDGERTVAELTAAVAPHGDSEGVAGDVTGALQALVEQGILTAAPAGRREPLPLDAGLWLPDGH